MLDPQARALINLMTERKVPPVHTLTPEQARASYRERRTFTQPDAPDVAQVQALSAPGPHGAVPLRLYRPFVASDALLVYFHGGGWTIGDLDTHDVLCRQLCLCSGCAVLSVDYRLGPEQRFPAAVDDCLAAVHYAQSEAAALGVNPARIAVGGDSAGGNLAAVVALLLRDEGRHVAFQLLIYPATDMRAIAPSHTSNGSGYLLTRESIAYYRRHYIGDAAQWFDWRASPLLAANLRGLPPALVLTAGFDPLRDEGHLYADAMSLEDTPVQYVCFERQVHGFITMGGVLDEARSAVALCAAVLKEALLSPAPATSP